MGRSLALVMLVLALPVLSAEATEGPILANLISTIPPGEYVGSNDNGPCSLKVSDLELSGVVLEIFEEGALRSDGSIDQSKWLSFPFRETDEGTVHARSFGEGQAYLEYTYNPDDRVSGTLVRTLNLDRQYVALKEKRKGLFSAEKSKECNLVSSPF